MLLIFTVPLKAFLHALHHSRETTHFGAIVWQSTADSSLSVGRRVRQDESCRLVREAPEGIRLLVIRVTEHHVLAFQDVFHEIIHGC
jgi:hypothetical protein